MSRDFDGMVAANALIAVDDDYDPQGGSTAFERAHVAALLEQAHQHVEALDQALERLEEGRRRYGDCETCGGTIPPNAWTSALPRPPASTALSTTRADRQTLPDAGRTASCSWFRGAVFHDEPRPAG
ncbi:TraR/DksA family transcriptional regulator [Streptomyces sp. Isolate_45]|uniref:TraR/DksA family transcriptional regulator n=1 Tax=Streptomyces sp. Isolate_45 TaxID=2950111 RepID=UPI0032B23598